MPALYRRRDPREPRQDRPPACRGSPRRPFDAVSTVLIGDTPNDVAAARDGGARILAFAASVDPGLAAAVGTGLAEIESAAATTAVPTAYVHDAIAACRESGRPVAVVSNNSAVAVHAYLEAHDLARQVAAVAARTGPDPATLKPSPYLIKQAASALSASPSACAVVGDSPADMQAARSAGAFSIGYASTPGEHEHMTRAGAGAIINSMAELTLRLRAQVANPEA